MSGTIASDKSAALGDESKYLETGKPAVSTIPLDSSDNAGLHLTNVDEDLARLGYAPELKRSLTVWAVMGLSFSIIAAPFGLSIGFSYALINGGPVTVLWGWVLVSLISLCIAASLGEICSCYPSSGGV
jgi:amino acid permease